MAYDYQKSKKIYQSLTKEQQQQYVDQNKNDANFQQFMKDYAADTNRNNAVSTPTNNSYQNQGAGNYSYNPQTQYYEKAPAYQNQGQGNYSYNPVSGYYENQNKPQTNQYTDYSKYNNNSDFYGQNNQYQGNADTINGTLGGMATDIYNQGQKGYSDLMGGGNYPQNFDDAVNNKLKSAFGLNSLDEVRQRYPEYYDSLVQALDSVQGVRDATDPSQRQMLDGQLQGIIGSVIGAGSDTSKLNVLNESLMNKFEDGEQVAKDMQNIVKLQTEGKTTSEIAEEMGISEDQVQQAILAYNGLDNKLGEYYKLKEGVAKDITEKFDTQMERNDAEKKIALERANRQVERLTQDFNTTLERQKQQNDINAHNADAIAGRTGLAFSKRGIEGLNYVAEQARQIIDDITKNYDRNNQNLADGIADIIRNWQYNNDDLMKASQDALTAAKNNFTSNMLAVQQQYGTVGIQAQQALANNVQGFIEQAQNIYDNALVRQQQNLTNLINNVSNINALEAQNLTMRNAKIQQFQAESMNLNRNQLQSLAQQLGMDSASYQDLVSYQAQAVANELNGYLPGAGVQFQSQIQSLLDQGYTPTQAMQNIMNSADFKAMQQAANGTADKWAMSNGIMYNQATGEYMNLNQTNDERGSAGGGTIYNKATGEVKTVSGGTVSTTNPDTGAYQRVKLNETPNEDTGIPNVLGSTVKLAPTVGAMFTEAYNALAAQGIELKVADSYRSYESQKQAYESGKAGVASPDKSYHVIGQAFDLSQRAEDGMKDNEEVTQALLDAGFTRPVASEWWHWSYGEGKDAFGGKPRNTDAYALARAVLDGTASAPAKNTSGYTDFAIALNDLKKQKRGDGYPEGLELINYSVVNDKELSDTLTSNISSTLQSLYSTDMLNKLLDENSDKVGPILSKLEGWNPYNADYAAINASIMQMASNVARGFGEKGVLTDADIERYMQTLPNQKMGKKAREVVGTLLKAKLYDGLVRTLESYAKGKRDVSAFAPEYQEAVNWLTENGFRSGGGRGLTADIDLSSYGRTGK